MRARRRFHGYTPTAARRTTNVMYGSRDDYTSASGMTVHIVCSSEDNPISEIPISKESLARVPSIDDEDDSLCSVIDTTERKPQQQFLNIRRRTENLPEDQQFEGIVTSLSSDSRDSKLALRKDTVIKISSYLPLTEELDESRDGSIQSDISDIFAPEQVEIDTPQSASTASVSLDNIGPNDTERELSTSETKQSFLAFRINYVIVTIAIMLADGLQGTHLYVLYEGYGYSVASLYCLGFVTGAVTSPITGPLVDRIGRKKAALLYCILEIGINMLEQYPILAGLIVSRMVGGITTNLLSSVFETWLDTEYRKRGFDEKKYEIIMRDSVVVSNLAAIASGYLAHHLAEKLGPVGPFEGAVTCTVIALAVVAAVWTENYGSAEPGVKSTYGYLKDAVQTFKSDSRVLRVGIIQGLTCGSIQIFIFLWSPALRELAKNAPRNVLGLDSAGEPAYGLIFGAFMASGVIGGLLAPKIREGVTQLLTPLTKGQTPKVLIEGEGEVRPMAVEFLAAACYLLCAVLLLTPILVSSDGEMSFSIALGSFLLYEFIVGVYMPCEGVIRSLYIPSDARCSLMTLPRIIVNIAVALGVILTNYISHKTAFYAVSALMVISAGIQLTLVSSREWASLFGKVDKLKRQYSRSISRMSSQLSLASLAGAYNTDDADKKKEKLQ
eukprot:CAMPEP_0194182942 /NCGR_PEP_ID=MMETSP0154-20130528/28444_1 /TAXON_ID=1049557 /ORGANISM="Thalassiothrix antarctica, Strain L6-D1" /LENGTH=668 /DNA_ID=CAMNT_0038899555 /DNA_START=39 /DNA_END=2045 /DNA_ORIENTATION=+